MKKTLFLGLSVVLIFATLVMAWNMITEEEVFTCIDTDFGLNEEIQGSTYGLTLNMSSYNKTDFCRPRSNTLIEFACDFNTTTNQTFVQVWEQNCSVGNFTNCSLGRCI